MSVLTYTDLHSTVVDKNKNPSEVDAAVWAHASVKFPPRKPIFRSNVSMNREGSKLRTPVASRTAGQHPTLKAKSAEKLKQQGRDHQGYSSKVKGNGKMRESGVLMNNRKSNLSFSCLWTDIFKLSRFINNLTYKD
ncbi:hypothetical protein OIU85_021256 [Salix viminalis]|uniref:Uncharacterized protein n=1 Tax=Salix viminalis TaxID=40686 RepID=A0A9Q0UI60_SALVM|nr:hypothetical protein OIU85_021256 [Salix viminalis]